MCSNDEWVWFQMATKNENHTAKQAMKEENDTKNIKFKPLPCEYLPLVLLRLHILD